MPTEGRTGSVVIEAMGVDASVSSTIVGMEAIGIPAGADLAPDPLDILAVDTGDTLAVVLGVAWMGKNAAQEV